MKRLNKSRNPVQDENHEDDQLPIMAQRAFENYPQITASDEFNQRVLERVMAARAPSRLELFCDRMDEIFARPILKLLGAACLGGILALAATGAMIGFNAPANPGEAPVQEAPLSARVDENPMAYGANSHNRLAMMRGLGVPYSLPFEGSEEFMRDFDAPAKREKSVEETDPQQRSSECLASFRSLV